MEPGARIVSVLARLPPGQGRTGFLAVPAVVDLGICSDCVGGKPLDLCVRIRPLFFLRVFRDHRAVFAVGQCRLPCTTPTMDID